MKNFEWASNRIKKVSVEKIWKFCHFSFLVDGIGEKSNRFLEDRIGDTLYETFYRSGNELVKTFWRSGDELDDESFDNFFMTCRVQSVCCRFGVNNFQS